LKAVLELAPVSSGGKLLVKQAEEGPGKAAAGIVMAAEASAGGRASSNIDGGDRIKRARNEHTLAELISVTTDVEQTQDHSKLAGP
jgi:hypothetical protein